MIRLGFCSFAVLEADNIGQSADAKRRCSSPGAGRAWLAAASLAALTALPSVSVAHGGGLNAQGCHNDRKNGGYHCHRGAEPAASTLSRTRRSAMQSFLGGGNTHYPNCAAVRAAGAAPIREGQPGYSRRLDRDGDGVACE